ncbi:MAG: DNA repair protein RadA [Microgenomates group bacterium]
MAKQKTQYVCQQCGWAHPKWVGQCQSCGEWQSMVEEQVVAEVSSLSSRPTTPKESAEIITFPQVKGMSAGKNRISTTIPEFDRVLGSDGVQQGMVPGAVMLIGGEPGIGKSTILTQVAISVVLDGGSEQPVVYVCGEESPSQIVIRIKRFLESLPKSGQLQWKKLQERLQFITTTDVDRVVNAMREVRPQMMIVDSIQTMTTTALTGLAGSVGQVRESADRLTTAAKELNVPLFLVGHVTKDGTISGPKILEHIVDAVLELSGERTGELRMLRAIKNRFGATDEVGVFRMQSFGYESVENPSALFLDQADERVAGSATISVVEGTRPFLVEVQALVVSSQLAMPRRVGRGVDLSRIQVLSAVLQKHCRLPLGMNDIFVNVAGGFTIREPAVDLGLAVAIASSLKNKPLPSKTVFIGEVGLQGEIRTVSLLDRRVKEAKRLGYKNIISRSEHKRLEEVLKQFGLL